MKAAALALISILGLTGGMPAQDVPPPAPDTDLETIRDWAASRMSAQAAGFKDMLQRALPMLQSGLGDDTTAIPSSIGPGSASVSASAPTRLMAPSATR